MEDVSKNGSTVLEMLGIVVTPVTIALLFLVYWFLKYPEKISYIRSDIAKCFCWAGTKFKKAQIADRMRGNILKASRIVTCENRHIAPYDLTIKWVGEKDREAFIEDNQIIVRMSNASNSDKNIVWAVNAYVKEGIIPLAKPYMPERLKQATDLIMTKKILGVFAKSSIPSFFCGPFSLYEKDNRLAVLVDDLQKVDNKGIFTRIYLNELAKLSNVPDIELPTEDLRNEIKDFAAFLIDLASRQRGEMSRLRFYRQHIKIAIILAASENSEEIIQINTDRVAGFMQSNFQTIYILALQRKMVVAKDLLQSIQDRWDFISAGQQYEYKHKTSSGILLDGICIELDLFFKPDVAFDTSIA